MKANRGIQFAPGRSFAARDHSERIAAMGFWHPPGSPESLPCWHGHDHGLLAMPFRHGLKTFRRTSMPARSPDWYLNNMVVRSDCQKRGPGFRILQRELSYVVDTSPFPSSLVTQKPRNVAFNERPGFQVVNDESVVIDGCSLSNWIVIRSHDRHECCVTRPAEHPETSSTSALACDRRKA
ncbi:hypothetical protein GLUCOINTEAF2_0203786 [Komagataeibacter intermedius AF2]|uniref:Acetyltransferase n=1 Tax=Komagataeibacter intermedius AF2 TaxID=1458464 RepID=A0A0C1V583_9PROT|nr:hypothetical protein GLUCOINTEAF2_0203832 [Komagataeibacter intermedius AF2]KPH88515.1 hypothetical protein GLUCOINTEAF2_0203786 [Komagataeibacter intermedius AF2]